MRIVKILPSFERSLKKISVPDKIKLQKSLHQLNNFLITGILPKGIGLKKLVNGIYELRVQKIQNQGISVKQGKPRKDA